jgi:hypothetical protein
MAYTEKATVYLKNFIGTSYEVGTRIDEVCYPRANLG